jgi:hypothetical protein
MQEKKIRLKMPCCRGHCSVKDRGNMFTYLRKHLTQCIQQEKNIKIGSKKKIYITLNMQNFGIWVAFRPLFNIKKQFVGTSITH